MKIKVYFGQSFSLLSELSEMPYLKESYYEGIDFSVIFLGLIKDVIVFCRLSVLNISSSDQNETSLF